MAQDCEGDTLNVEIVGATTPATITYTLTNTGTGIVVGDAPGKHEDNQ